MLFSNSIQNLENRPASSSLIPCCREIQAINNNNDYPKRSVVDWGLGGAIAGGILGAAISSLYTDHCNKWAVQDMSQKYFWERSVPLQRSVVGWGLVGGVAGCILLATISSLYTDQCNKWADNQAIKIHNIFVRCVELIDSYMSNGSVSDSSEDQFLKEMRDTSFNCISNRSKNNFKLKLGTFNEFNTYKRGISNKLQLVFLMAISTIKGIKRSVQSTVEELNRAIKLNQDNTELVCFANYFVAKCYKELGNNVIVKARKKCDYITNNSTNQDLQTTALLFKSTLIHPH